MTYRQPTKITALPSSSPSDLLGDLEAILRARGKLKDEQEKAAEESAAMRLRWTRELALEAAKGVNMQSVVGRHKDLQSKELRLKEQADSLVSALKELEHAIAYYEKEHRQDLLQALQTRLDQVGDACKEYTELEKWRDLLVRPKKDAPGKPAAGKKAKKQGAKAAGR